MAITVPNTYRSSKIGVDQFGNLTYPDANNNQQNIGIQIGLAYFPNAGGLEKTSNSNYLQSGGVRSTYGLYGNRIKFENCIRLLGEFKRTGSR